MVFRSTSPTLLYFFCSPRLVLFITLIVTKYLYRNEILNISENIGSTKKADHILEIPGLEEFCGYCFKNNTRERELTTKRLEIIKYQRRLSNCLATVMFRGTPCLFGKILDPFCNLKHFKTLLKY